MERYTCLPELLPVIESALAAAGFVLEAPLQRIVNATRITVMTRGDAVICMYEDSARDMADIHIYPNGDMSGLAVLRELPHLLSPREQHCGVRFAGVAARLHPRSPHD